MAARKDRRRGWVADFWFHHADGRRERVRKVSPVQSRAGAEEYERRLRTNLLTTGFLHGPMTYQEIWSAYMKWCETAYRPSHCTHKQYLYDKHIADVLGDVAGVKRSHLEKLTATLRPKNLSVKSINNILSIVRASLHWAKKGELIDHVPNIQLLKNTAPGADDVLFLSDEHYAQLVSRLNGDLLIVTLLGGDAGLRKGEILGLEWQDVLWSNGTIRVRRSVNGKEVVVPKSGKARSVPMTGRLQSHLEGSKQDEGRVLRDWTPEKMRWWEHKMYDRAGLTVPKQPLHVLRHTFCSRLAAAGVPAPVIQQLAGHSTILTTQRYMHLAPKTLRDAIVRLNNAARSDFLARLIRMEETTPGEGAEDITEPKLPKEVLALLKSGHYLGTEETSPTTQHEKVK